MDDAKIEKPPFVQDSSGPSKADGVMDCSQSLTDVSVTMKSNTVNNTMDNTHAKTNAEYNSECNTDEKSPKENEISLIGAPVNDPDTTQIEAPEPPYSIFTHGQKIATVLSVSFLALLSPLSGQIYLPVLTSLADDLHVSASQINLTITTYMIIQGIAPSFIGNMSDVYGRRPAYLLCFVIYMCANLGLALQNSYAALMVLRCLQSAGSSATISLSSATVADMITRAERGKFIGYAAMGVTLGPALGPVAGGLLAEHFGWRGIFWFLLVLAGVLFVGMIAFLPETCRNVVGNGSVPAPWWNMSLYQYIRTRCKTPGERAAAAHTETVQRRKRRPNPFAALRILAEPEGGVTLGYNALMAAGYFMVLNTFSEQLTERFNFSTVTVGLCYLPLGMGNLSSRWTVGILLDWNFRRWARKLNITIDLDRQQNLDIFPIEKIRLQISIVAIYIACIATLGYGWALQTRASLAAIEVVLFIFGLCFSGALNGINTLVVDTHPESPATAVAANNLFRCLISAAATAFSLPLIHRIGMGWTSVFIVGVLLAFSPFLWIVMFHGHKWRKASLEKEKKKKAARESAV